MNKHWQKAFDQTTKKKNYFTFSTQNMLILQCNWDISFFLQNEQLFLSPIKSKKRLIIYLLRIYLNFKKLKDILSYLLTFELIPLISFGILLISFDSRWVYSNFSEYLSTCWWHWAIQIRPRSSQTVVEHSKWNLRENYVEAVVRKSSELQILAQIYSLKICPCIK